MKTLALILTCLITSMNAGCMLQPIPASVVPPVLAEDEGAWRVAVDSETGRALSYHHTEDGALHRLRRAATEKGTISVAVTRSETIRLALRHPVDATAIDKSLRERPSGWFVVGDTIQGPFTSRLAAWVWAAGRE